MKSIVKKLQQLSPDRFYVIDFMPNLKWLLGNNYFIKECNTEFRSFESKVGANALEKDLEECVFLLLDGSNKYSINELFNEYKNIP